MAKTTFSSPGIYNIESQATRPPLSVNAIGGAFIGVTNKGPAFFPKQVTNFNDFTTIFGQLNSKMYVPYAVQSYLQNGPVATIVRVLGKGNPNTGYTVDLGRAFDIGFGNSDINVASASSVASYTAATSGMATMCILRSRQQVVGTDLINDVTYTGNESSFSATIAGVTYGPLSLDRTQKNYIENIFGTDPTVVYNGDSATGIYVDAVLNYLYGSFTGGFTGSSYGSLSNPASASVSGIRNITGGYRTPESPMIVSQPYVSGTSVMVYNLFQIIALSDGEAANQDVKISIVDVETTTVNYKTAPKFTILVRDFADTDARPVVYERHRVNLDSQDNDYFISKVIGDSYNVITIDAPGATPTMQTEPVNGYPNNSAFIRISLEPGYKFDARPAGFVGPPTITPPQGTTTLISNIPLKTDFLDYNSGVKTSKIFPGYMFESTGSIGGSDRLKGSFAGVDGSTVTRGFMMLATTAESTASYNNPSLSSAYNASLTGNYTLMDITVTGSSSIVQNQYQFSFPLYGGHDGIPPAVPYDIAINNGTLSAEFQSALNTLANAYQQPDFDLLLTPGVHSGAGAYNGNFCSLAIDLAEQRQDFFYLLDGGQPLSPTDTNITTDAMNASPQDMITTALGFNSNRAAMYYPWLRIFDSNIQNFVFVPPSVEVAGIYAYTDNNTFPWFAPAGYNRGTLTNVPQVRRNLAQTDADLLYPGRVNPIIMIKYQGPVIFGQKTLQQDPGDLTSINIVRMLITVERNIALMARSSLFEFNDAVQRNALKDAINAYLSRVQAQRGLALFVITINESNNTQAVIDQNQMVGLLLLAPVHPAETIIFNYVLSSAGFILTQQ